MESIHYLWKDRKRYFCLPISFTRYRLSGSRIFRETGLLNLREEEVLLYRGRDLEVTRSLWQRIFRVGTICIHSSDKTSPPSGSGERAGRQGGQGTDLPSGGAGQERAADAGHRAGGRRV